MSELVNEAVVETVEPIEVESSNVDTQESTPVVEQVKEKPWAKEKKVPDSIPYDRFSEVNKKFREAEKALEEERRVRQELEQKLNTPAPKKEPVSSGDTEYDSLVNLASEYGIEAPDIDQFETMAEFNRAERKFQAQLAEIKAEVKFNQLKSQEQQIQELNKINQEFMQKAETVKTYIPDLDQAFNYFRQYSSMVPPEIQKAISTHPNGPELLYSIVSDEANLVKLINHPKNPYYDPIEAQIFIRTFKPDTREATTTIPEPVSKPVVPTKVKGSSGISDPYTASSMAEYRKARLKQS